MTRIKVKLLSVVLAVLMIVLGCFFAACDNNDDNNNNSNGNNNGDNGNVVVPPIINYVKLTGFVRTTSFAPVQDSIVYDGEVVAQTDAEGRFEITVAEGTNDTYTKNVGLASNSFTYIEDNNGKQSLVIVKLDEGMTLDDFYLLSGKVVLHSDGETVAPGVELKVDGVTVRVIENDRNYGLPPIHKDSVVSAYKEGCEFIDISFIPYNDLCFADKLADVTETYQITLNGQTVKMKIISGITFRLKDVD